ncbi:response regulator [Leptospira borgpetersenii]|uniref:Response regulator of a two component regulator n=4 Tax=Leptospira TaxID=171 RepID=Q04QU2_LEPBJ|nr:response regulator [Leptospira borgpetersenii]EMO65270.1 response regulator receiver domain protein [Leptospira borgpetersenii serovar Pomona str. 200901868]ABJ76728.1 Response regulator of a two component regulator [Leptospira borgpetersenii serovar Hardjo-bovis str. JB197]ABJ78409.1 Response regulator of a two component regulator [Leptospira borgpetersenii serovar Hardjo-bovis str. L550]AMX57640.1 chemotaxis protein CheY [Leptospira borgpetersenii serovar Hardjo]AMX60873.1 chemotaxis prot
MYDLQDQSISILYAEDNPQDSELTLRSLKRHNLTNQVKLVRDGEEALEYLYATGRYENRDKAQLPSLILLDLKMPKVDGIEVLRKVRSEEFTKMLPVVILTSSAEEKDIVESYRLGVNSYVVKPLDFDKFSEVASEIGFYWILVNQGIGK